MTSTSIFIWREPSEWEPQIAKAIPAGLLSDLVLSVRRNRSGFRYLDDVGYFKEIYSRIADYDDLAQSLPSHLRDSFLYVRMFHCCRVVSITTYHKHGIKVLDPSEAEAQFRSIFTGNPRFPMIAKDQVDAAIKSMKDSYRRGGRVYFGLDDRYLIEFCGHYLIYGSEYLQGLVARIEGETGHRAKSELKRFGVPTVISVNVPIIQFSDNELFELGEAAFHAWAYRIIHPKGEIREIDFAIDIDQTIAPDLIQGYYHPESVPDPFHHRIPYEYKAVTLA